MSLVIDQIRTSEYVYSTFTKWGLKRYLCDVAYFTESPLDDLFYVICSIISSKRDGHYDKRSLGILLGFSMTDHVLNGEQDVYYDVAEVRLFEDILNKVEEEHLITISDNDIFLTKLGKISVKEGKLYHFYKGVQPLYEHAVVKSDMPTALLMFPFYNDMGIYTTIGHSKKIWPDDEDIEDIIYHHPEPLKKRLELQSQTPANIYSAKLQQYFDLENKEVHVKLYQHGNVYLPVIMNEDKYAPCATELLSKDINTLQRENVILECLFQKLWDDDNSVLNYKELEPYVELIDFEELTKDSRTVWTDPKLLDLIVDRATSTCWRNISRHCDMDVLRRHIDEYRKNLDWGTLSERIDDDFLVSHFKDYPWDLEAISCDTNRDIHVVEQLILQEKDTEEDWEWEELGTRLSQEFILNHLDVVKVNLSAFTDDTDNIRQAIVDNPNNRWDWTKIEKDFDLQFILNHISTLGENYIYTILFDRVFSDERWSNVFVNDLSFKTAIAKASNEGGVLSSLLFNEKNYIWTDDVIHLFTDNHLLNWESTPYMIGFECNDNVVWNSSFFKKYAANIKTEDGKRHISSKIMDVSILSDNPNFGWDWNKISSNKAVLSDKTLYIKFGDKLNWTIVFNTNQDISHLQTIDNIQTKIGGDTEAWSVFSRKASIDYVIETYKSSQYPWDWTVLTERMFQNLKLENLGNKFFVDKWDWTYLSTHVDGDFLLSHLETFKNYWNWEVCLPRILTKENRLDELFLDNLAEILTNISGKEKCNSAWTALSSQYSFNELKSLIKSTARKRSYWWDMTYFCQHKDFNVFSDLEDCRNFVDWKVLSSSPTIDKFLQFNPRLKIQEKAWFDRVRQILADKRFHWDYTLLSHFESLRDQKWFIAQYKDLLDWGYISQFSKVFCAQNKQELNEVIEAYNKYVDFSLLSQRDDVDILQVMKINPHANYDFNLLLKKGIFIPTEKEVKSHADYQWDWQLLSSSELFKPSASFLLEHIDCDFNWMLLSQQDNHLAWSSIQLIIKVASNIEISQQIDWKTLSSFDFFPITPQVMSHVPLGKLDWKCLSSKDSIIPYINQCIDYVDWKILSANEKFRIDSLSIDKYRKHLDWSVICRRKEFKFTNDIVEKFADYIDWSLASASLTLKFSKPFVDKYKDKWDWPILVKNKAFNNRVDMSDLSYVRQQRIVDFIQHFPKNRPPKAYHFTHMANAVKIINTTKLQSRNAANGNFSNSAGINVVNRKSAAHAFARFYFAPKSPTQFYNECLGKDQGDPYYSRAAKLGFPKCPLPVFFVFDVEELLTTMPEKCYYSNGNMQKDGTSYFKVIDNPNEIDASGVYDEYNKDARQQEFLIIDELDFSKLKNVGIFCYDEYQASLLRKELEGTVWEDLVDVASNLYVRKNREIFFQQKEDGIGITSSYASPFTFRLHYEGKAIPVINNKKDITGHKGNDIFVSRKIEVNTEVPFEVYFEVNTPTSSSWLIYKNR